MMYTYKPYPPYIYASYPMYYYSKSLLNQNHEQFRDHRCVQWKRNHYPKRCIRQLPPVDPELFMSSANEGQMLVEELKKILNRISTDANYARQMMESARESNMDEVNRLIAETRIVVAVDTAFDPDGMRLEIKTDRRQSELSRLTLFLRWQTPPYV